MAIKLRTWRVALLAGCATAALATALPAAASAEGPARNYAIGAQDLDAALRAFAMASGHDVVFDPAVVKGRTTAGVNGAVSDEAALKALLAGTDLAFEQTPSGGFVVRAPRFQADEGGSGADGTVQALIVTAQKREEDIQDVPIAISAFTQEDLTRSQIAGGPDLMTQVPNMTFTKTNFSSYSIQIRGIGTQAISATTDPAVAVAFNNTPFIRNHFFEQEFYDLERVEVLRGPQGTLYGRNATAGVVNVISAKPKNHFEAKLSGDLSNYNSSRFEGMINLPLVEDKAALRIAGAWTKRDGFVKNILTGQQTDGRDLWSARVTLGLTPADNFKANLIFEHFEENDDRLRSGKQLCHKDPGPAEVNGVPAPQTGYALSPQFSQGCKPASLYSPDSFQTPNGYALPYYGAAGALGSPIYIDLDPYLNGAQSRDLREIETHLEPDYEASSDVVELQMTWDLSDNLTLASETGYSRDFIFSFEDYNRFDTTPNVFAPGAAAGHHQPDGAVGDRLDVVDINGVFCDPQLGCTNRLAAGDLAMARSKQVSQEFRLSSNYDGKMNFSLGANFLRYDTEDKYYVFINTLTAFVAGYSNPWMAGVSDGSRRIEADPNAVSDDYNGWAWSDVNGIYGIGGVVYVDPNNIHNLNDQGRNYFLSRNPYHLISYAGFGEIYYQIAPNLKLTGGFRWTVDKKQAPQIPSWLLAARSYGTPTRKVIEQEWREPTGRIALDWKPDLSITDETLVYASYVRGYKAGGANPPPAIPVFPPVGGLGGEDPIGQAIIQDTLTHPQTFEPEFVDAFEVGTKNTLLDGRMTFNLNAFYYDYTGYQISEIVDRSAVNLNFDAKIWGSELEVDWRPLENLRLGFKSGYENTRLADGSKAVDLMDRTAGMPGWVLRKPFPTFSSNCVLPKQFAFLIGCEGYKLGTDPVSGLPFDPYTILPYVANPTEMRQANGDIVPLNPPDYPGFDPRTAPNNGEGFAKDLSGNKLPNAPKFTATITADYTLPLPNSWLMTLHTDLYYQSEAWTRIFNTPGYDKLKAYNNINVAAIFSNEDAGWQVMAYVKNLLDRDSITGAFLNSDDTGLTTNVFLTEPRLYGLRVTKTWSGSGWWSARANRSGYYPFRLEFNGDYGRFSGGHEVLAPATVALFPAEHPYPLGIQGDLDDGSAGGVKFTYQPEPKGWSISAGVRYGRATGGAEGHDVWYNPGGYTTHKYHSHGENKYVDAWPSYATTTAKSEETYAIADFMVGRDVGLGAGDLANSSLSAGLRVAHFKSTSDVIMHGRPDFIVPPDDVFKYGSTMHRFHAKVLTSREFEGAGPAVSWSQTMRLGGDRNAAGEVGIDLGLGGSILFGKQTTVETGQIHGDFTTTAHIGSFYETSIRYETPISIHRTTNATVPSINANLGLAYTVGGVTLSGGYRIERYFDAIDGGIAERKTYDRQFDGPYFKVSVGFGG